MRRLRFMISLFFAALLLFSCTFGSSDPAVTATVNIEIAGPADGKAFGARSLIDDPAVLSVTVAAEDSLGTSLGTVSLAKGTTKWTGSMTIDATGLVTFRARGWSGLGGTGSALYYGICEVTVTPADTTLSVSIGTVLQSMTWTERSVKIDPATGNGSRSWTGIASSNDGMKLAAVCYWGYIYTSTDGGATWTARKNDLRRDWSAIASSSDGKSLAALSLNSYADENAEAQPDQAVFISEDYGVTWTRQINTGSHEWNDIASSADGMMLAAAPNNGRIHTSGNPSMDEWEERAGSDILDWQRIASSSLGNKLVAIGGLWIDYRYQGDIYTSSDSGATWIKKNCGHNFWVLTSSADGAKLAAAAQDDSIYTSTDSGATWTERTGVGPKSWKSIASSADGTKLVATLQWEEDSLIYTSPDGGAAWTAQTTGLPTGIIMRDVTCSADGTKMAAVVEDGYIYTAGY